MMPERGSGGEIDEQATCAKMRALIQLIPSSVDLPVTRAALFARAPQEGRDKFDRLCPRVPLHRIRQRLTWSTSAPFRANPSRRVSGRSRGTLQTMPEHQFGFATVEKWQTLADRTRTELDMWTMVSDPHLPRRQRLCWSCGN